MLRVAVVEDETEQRGLIQEMVGRYAKEYDLQIQTTAFPDGRELVQNYHKFDILLMDIEMPHLNGMEAAQKIRELDKEVVIVFTSAQPAQRRTAAARFHRSCTDGISGHRTGG